MIQYMHAAFINFVLKSDLHAMKLKLKGSYIILNTKMYSVFLSCVALITTLIL